MKSKAKKLRHESADDRALVTVVCAFCGGEGRDPFDIMSPLAVCQVCSGKGYHTLAEPIAPCAFCRGTGVHPHSRNTCTSCTGIGMVIIPRDAVTCPRCGGTGRAAEAGWPDSPLSCSYCRGKGVVAAGQVREAAE